MSNLKARLKKLEEVANPKELSGIVLFYKNAVREEVDNVSEIVSADYYLNRKGDGDPLSDAEIEKALDGKEYICHLPITRERPEFDEVTA